MFLTIVLTLIVLFVLLKFYVVIIKSRCTSQTCLVGKTVIVTGANTGIGFEAALDFAKRGAKVILGCRDIKRATEAKERIISETGNKNIIVQIIDFSDFESVRKFAKTINETETQLDILCNNAGAAGIPYKKTKDGHTLIMQINYFSHFLLTNLLIDLLKKSAPSRIVNVASVGAKWAELQMENLDYFPGLYASYYNSKLCNILFTQEIAKRLVNTGVTTYSLHPGVVYTDIFRRLTGWQKKLLEIVASVYFRTPEEGAQTIIHTAVTKGIEDCTGQHFEDCKMVKTYKTASDPTLSAKLWESTIKTIKIGPEELKI